MEGVNLIHSKLRLLLFADDLVLLSETSQDLQSAVDLLCEYCSRWDLQVNLTKTKLIPFNGRKRAISGLSVRLNGAEIEVVNEYKYLGLVFTVTGSLKTGVNTLVAQANKALFSLMKSAARLDYPSPKVLCHLFDSLVRPILEYASEVWFPSVNEEAELLHRRFCKFALGLPTSTTNAAVYGELGRLPLNVRQKIALLKYWFRIRTTGNTSPLLQEIYQLISGDPSNTWLNGIQSILNETGFSGVWSNPEEVGQAELIGAIQQRLHDQYLQEWGSTIMASRKLRTYRLFKNSWGYELYLNLPPNLRVPLARLRTSAHGLKIEIGRYTLPHPTPVEDRVCDFCDVLEDEVHFLIDCPVTNSSAKSSLFLRCASSDSSFMYRSSLDKFIFIMKLKDVNSLSLLATAVKTGFKSRLCVTS